MLVTAGPTHEPIDPVRYIANRSSGRQGFAIAGALAALGARVTLVAGPVTLPTPPGVTRVNVETARDMAQAVADALPADAAVMVAAVADWRVEAAGQKVKKDGGAAPALTLVENPDILATVAAAPNRPALVVGFAAETEHVIDHAVAKRLRKRADWIVANDVSGTCSAATRTVSISSPPMASRAGNGWARTRLPGARATYRGCATSRVMTTAPISIAIKYLPHGEGLPLPAYATPVRRAWMWSRPKR